MALVSESSLATQDLLLRQERARVQVETLRSVRREDARVKGVERAALWFLLGVVTLFISVSTTVSGLGLQFPEAYEWSKSQVDNLDPRFPRPQGATRVTVETAAVNATYPLLGTLGSLAFIMPKMSREGSLFLLQILGGYGKSRNIKGVHLNGSASQLRFDHLDLFLPTGNGSTVKSVPNWSYIWESWSALTASGDSANPWYNTLWLNEDEFRLSPAIQDYYGVDTGGAISRPPQRGLVESLFRGGLAYVAQNNFDDEITADQMVKNLLGRRFVQEGRPCKAVQVAHNAISNGTQWASYGMLGMMPAQAFWTKFVVEGFFNITEDTPEAEVAKVTKYGILAAVTLVGGIGAAGAVKGAADKTCGVTTAVSA